DWVTNVETTHYVIGSVVGPHPFPMLVRDFQRIIGVEARQQCLELVGRLPDAVVACVGGGSNAMGLFHPFLDDASVALLGCEAGGDGVETGRHAAPLTAGSPGVLHGSRSYLMQDEDGQTLDTTSISAGLDYPGVGPEHSLLRDSGRATYTGIPDGQAMAALELVAKQEGILVAIETAHAFAGAFAWIEQQGGDPAELVVIVNSSGRGDKDADTAARWFGLVTGEQVAESELVRAREGEQP
ncbi:MAG: pyridoxal-phosphate dependent enzyme, partial [Actinobacteria bacterium]|nr:pyridoxal-phosphate dependent enzyme [Actinomycetota bacterium]